MSRITLLLASGLALFETGIGAAQPTQETSPTAVTLATTDEADSTPATLLPQSTQANSVLNPQSTTQPATPEAPLVPPEQPAMPAPNTGVTQPLAPAAPAPLQSAPAPNAAWVTPEYPPRIIILQPAPSRKVERDKRTFTFGVGPLILANAHWLDQPADKAVSVGSRQGVNEQYPGFVGLDATLGLMLDVRYQHFIGVEIDLLLQNDRGTGTINIQDAGSICFIPGVNIAYPTHSYDVTIGQMAWHVPLLFKLSLPGRWEAAHEDGDVDREIRKSFSTLAFGPEFVFPRSASLTVAPAGGLDYPERAFASNYIMYTGALGFERRVSDSHDIRLLFSVRGSYNPTAGDSAMKRAQYDIAVGNIVAVSYRSEWRYQAAFTLGVGWFF